MGFSLKDEAGRLRPGLRVVAYVPAWLLANVVLTIAAFGLVFAVGAGALLFQPLAWDSPTAAMALGITFTASVLVTWAFRRWLDGASLRSLGLWLSGSWLWQLGAGFALGVVLMAVVFAFQLAAGGYVVESVLPEGPGAAAGTLGLMLVLFLLVSVGEELVARGYLLQNLELEWGAPAALVASSLLFALGHMANPGATLVSTAAIAGAGVLLGATYLATRALWAPIGLHWSWNLFQGPVFGFPVSGMGGGSVLETVAVGPEWLTGGAFGPEASVVTVALELVVAAVLLRRAKRLSGE